MTLPITVNNTYAALQSVSAQDIMDMQEQIAGFWRFRRRARRMQLSVYAAQSGGGSVFAQQWPTWGPGYRAATASNQDLFYPFRLRYSSRLRNIRVGYQTGGGVTMTWALIRAQQPGGSSTLASGTLPVAGGAYNFASLFASPFPKHALRQVAGVDVHFELVVTSANNADRCYGLQVDYDHPGITL